MKRLLNELVTRTQQILETRFVSDHGARAHLRRRLTDGIGGMPPHERQNQWLAVASIALAAAVELENERSGE